MRRKARCDEERPSCGRCTSRNIHCVYPTNTTQVVSRDSRIRRRNSRLHKRASPSLATDLTSVANNLGAQEDDMHSVATSAAPRSESWDLGVVESSWDDLAIDLNLVCTPRLFIQRPKTTTGGQRTATLIRYTLQSYAQRLLHQNDMPPFIHPYSKSAIGGSEPRIGSLNTCASLLHVLHCGVPGSPALFWRNVQCECERLRNEVC